MYKALRPIYSHRPLRTRKNELWMAFNPTIYPATCRAAAARMAPKVRVEFQHLMMLDDQNRLTEAEAARFDLLLERQLGDVQPSEVRAQMRSMATLELIGA